MANPRERWNDMEESMRAAVDRHLGTVWTALPVTVVEDSKDGHVVKVQSTIKGWQQQDDGSVKAVPIPEFGMVPIHHPSGGGFTVTHPVKKDDEGLVVFSSRCIDGWWKEGGVQAEPYRRKHSLSDAMYIPGIRSKPRKINPFVSKDTAQFRSDDQHFYVEIAKDKVKIVFATDKDEGEQFDEGEEGPEEGQEGDKEEEEKEKKTTPRMVLEVSEDKIMGTVLDENGKETSYFEHTKDGYFRVKAPKEILLDTPLVKITGKIVASGEITAKVSGTVQADGTVIPDEDDRAGGGSVSMSQHRHPQGNDSRGDKELDTGVPISGS